MDENSRDHWISFDVTSLRIRNFALFINDSYAFCRCTQSQQGFNLQHSQQVIKFHENQVADIKRFAYRRLCLPLLHECKDQWWRCQDLFFNHLRCLARVVSCTMNLPAKEQGDIHNFLCKMAYDFFLYFFLINLIFTGKILFFHD